MQLPPLFQIGDLLVSTDIITECFCCDYPVCRGACCIEGESGAPLQEEEIPRLQQQYSLYSPLMSEEGRAVVQEGGFGTVDRDGDLVTPLVGREQCVFSVLDPDKGCLCAIECAGCVKPVSCALYPIRVSRMRSGLLALNLHRWDICKCAFSKGRREGVRVYEFLRGPITRSFGEEAWQAMDAFRKQYCK